MLLNYRTEPPKLSIDESGESAEEGKTMPRRGQDRRITVALAGCVLLSLTLGLGQSVAQTAPTRLGHDNWSCLKRDDLWRNQKGRPVWLNSDELIDRAIESRSIERPGSLGRNSVKGSVTIELIIDRDGNVDCARVTKGHPLAMGAAIR